MPRAEITIREATDEDAQTVVEVLRSAFEPLRPNYTDTAIALTISDEEGIRKRIAEGPVWLAFVEGRPVGSVSVASRNEKLYIRGMGVDPSAQGQGIGTALMQAIEAYASERGFRHLHLHTTPFLHAAITLYERFGFKRVGETIDWEGTPVFLMERTGPD